MGKAAALSLIRAAAFKSAQAKPNKSKQNSLDLFGFARPNRDFSKGYGQSKQQFRPRLRLLPNISSARPLSFSSSSRAW
jgi:hypothetical protein